MTLTLDIQRATSEPLPEDDEFSIWIAAALQRAQEAGPTEISLRVVDRDEMAHLNETYRDHSGPTNVLSFAAGLPEEVNLPLLGDIVICAPVVLAEAKAQGKDPKAHWAHMAIHGTLHLLGHDHIEPTEAEAMEAIESAVLADLGYSCPYCVRVTAEKTVA
jgi:probable rRNA maturation factor